ncbi:putative DUF563 domain-containing protein [Azospirillaceae bacterium]
MQKVKGHASIIRLVGDGLRMNSPSILHQAVERHQNGDLATAEALYRQKLAETPDDPDALRLLGVLMRQKGDDGSALKLFRRTLILRPSMVEGWFNLGNLLVDMGRDVEAETAYRRVLTPSDGCASDIEPDAWNNLGALLLRRGAMQAAESAFAGALSIRPDFLAARINRANALRDLGRIEEAWDVCRDALAAAPDDLDALDAAAAILHRLDRLEQAQEACRRALALNPAHVRALANSGVIFSSLDQWESAIAAWRQAVSLAPDDPETWRDLGRALLRMKRFSEAEEALTRVTALKPDDASAWFELGRARFAARDHPGDALDAALDAHRKGARCEGRATLLLRPLRIVPAADLCAARGWPYHRILSARSEIIETESSAWPRVACDFPEVFLARVDDATVIPANFTVILESTSKREEDVLILDGLHVYSRASLTMVPGFICHTPDDRVLWEESGQERRFEDEAILLGGDRNFSHGVLDWLSKVWVCAQSPFLSRSDMPVLIAADLLPPIAGLLELLGVDHRRFVPVFAHERLRCRRLWLPSTTHCYQQMNPHYAEWLRRRVFESLSVSSSTPPYRRLYLSRRNAKTRSLLNEAEVLKHLSKCGVEAISPEDFSIETQIRMFSEASLIVGPVGGGSAAMMFAPSNASVVELTHHRIVLPQYGLIARCLGQKYRQIVGSTVRNRNPFQTNFDWDFSISLPELDECLRSLM